MPPGLHSRLVRKKILTKRDRLVVDSGTALSVYPGHPPNNSTLLLSSTLFGRGTRMQNGSLPGAYTTARLHDASSVLDTSFTSRPHQLHRLVRYVWDTLATLSADTHHTVTPFHMQCQHSSAWIGAVNMCCRSLWYCPQNHALFCPILQGQGTD